MARYAVMGNGSCGETDDPAEALVWLNNGLDATLYVNISEPPNLDAQVKALAAQSVGARGPELARLFLAAIELGKPYGASLMCGELYRRLRADLLKQRIAARAEALAGDAPEPR